MNPSVITSLETRCRCVRCGIQRESLAELQAQRSWKSVNVNEPSVPERIISEFPRLRSLA